jgi:drug/metabolite transporter (DMT)-like permease
VTDRPPWSHRRRYTLVGLAAGIVVFGVGAIALPDEYGVKSLFLAALCGFLLVVATVVFVAIPGPDTLRTLLHTVPLAGAVLVVAVLLLLSTSADLRWLWSLITVAAAAWTATAIWETRRSGRGL